MTTINKSKKTVSKKKIITFLNNEQMEEKIAKKAYELYESRGKINGSSEEDWYQAQKIINSELEPTK